MNGAAAVGGGCDLGSSLIILRRPCRPVSSRPRFGINDPKGRATCGLRSGKTEPSEVTGDQQRVERGVPCRLVESADHLQPCSASGGSLTAESQNSPMARTTDAKASSAVGLMT